MPDLPTMEVTQESIAALLTQVTEQNRLIALLLGKVEALELKSSNPPSPPTQAPSASPNPPPTETPAAVNAPVEPADSNPNAPPHVPVDVAPAATVEPESAPPNPPQTETPTVVDAPVEHADSDPNAPPHVPADVVPAAAAEPEGSVLPTRASSKVASATSSSNASEATSPAAPSTPNPASPPPGSVPMWHPGTHPYPSIFAPHPIVRNYPPQFYYQYPSFYPPPMWPVSPNGAASPAGPMGFYPPIPFPPIPSEGASSERGAQPSTPSVSSERPVLEPEAAPKKSRAKPASVPRQDTAGTAANSTKSGPGKTRKTNQECMFGANCTRPVCQYEHPARPCRFATRCTRPGCFYDHPPGWSTSNMVPDEADAEGTWGEDSHDDTPATDNTASNGWGDETQAVEIDNTGGEDANVDFGNWADAPADWGFPPTTEWGTPAGDSQEAPVNNDWGASPKDDKKTLQKQGNSTKPRENEKAKKKKSQKAERPVATTSTTATTTTPSARAPSVVPSSHAPSIAPSRASSVAPSSRASSSRVSSSRAPSSHAPSSHAPSSHTPSSRAPSVQRTEPTNHATLDVLDTPSLDRADTPNSPLASSEPETPTASFSWADEPCAIAVASSDEPHETRPSSPQIQEPEDSLLDIPTEDDANDEKAPVEPVDLDEFAPSQIYDSWAPSVADWGFIPEEPAAVDDANPNATSGSDHNTWAPKEDYSWGDPPSEPEDNRTKSKKRGGSTSTARDNGQTGGSENKSSAKAKGKGKENPQGQTATGSQSKNKSGPGQSKNKPPAASSHSSSSVATTPSTPATSPADSATEPPLSVLPVLQAPPPGVPEEEIPDWLLGADEDPHATLGLSRPPTPEPPTPARVEPGPSRPKLQNMPAESFPALRPAPAHEPAATSVASDTVIRPKRRGWTILPETPDATEGKTTKSSGQQRKRTNYGKGKRST